MPTLSTIPAAHLVAATQEPVDSGAVGAPLAVIDVAAFDYNARQMVQRAHGLPIRVASKSVRSVDALRRALSHDGYKGILAYSLAEAILLVRQGFSDIVVAYPCVDRRLLAELAGDAVLTREITLMVDCPAHLDLIEGLIEQGLDDAAASAGSGPVRVAIDVDCALHLPGLVIGPRRSPVRTPEQAGELARDIARRPRLKLVGMMAYEGQVASVPDAAGGITGRAKRWLREKSMADLAPRRLSCIEAVRQVADLEFVNGGGSGSLELSAAEGTLTELAAGSGFYTPAIFDAFSAMNNKAAAFFVCQVSRIPAPGWVTVNSGGWIASGPPAADRAPVPVRPAGLKYSATEGAGEVQTPLHGAAADELTVGDLVWFRHAKAGEMTEHVDSLLAVAGDGTTQQWTTYRGQGWTLR